MGQKINEIIKEFRLKKKLSQKDVAEVMGVSNVAVSKWESGENRIYAEDFEKLKEFLGIKTTENERDRTPTKKIFLERFHELEKRITSLEQGNYSKIKYCSLIIGEKPTQNYRIAEAFQQIGVNQGVYVCESLTHATNFLDELSEKTSIIIIDERSIGNKVDLNYFLQYCRQKTHVAKIPVLCITNRSDVYPKHDFFETMSIVDREEMRSKLSLINLNWRDYE